MRLGHYQLQQAQRHQHPEVQGVEGPVGRPATGAKQAGGVDGTFSPQVRIFSAHPQPQTPQAPRALTQAQRERRSRSPWVPGTGTPGTGFCFCFFPESHGGQEARVQEQPGNKHHGRVRFLTPQSPQQTTSHLRRSS